LACTQVTCNELEIFGFEWGEFVSLRRSKKGDTGCYQCPVKLPKTDKMEYKSVW
jgi:hypothetical protein